MLLGLCVSASAQRSAVASALPEAPLAKSIAAGAALAGAPSEAQTPRPAEPQIETPPEAPVPRASSGQGAPTAAISGITTVSGTVQDATGAVVAGATVTLIPIGHFGETKGTTGADGSFSFASIPPGSYHLSVEARGLTPYTSPEFLVRAETAVTLPPVTLKTEATTTSINVVANPQQIALAEIHEQETQRVFGVFQNFYTSYIWDAQPMPTKQKYTLALRSLIDPPQFLIVAGLAGAEQYEGTYPGYGPGIGGYGKRYGAALADEVDGRLLGSALLPAVLHQDPRYFYQGSGSVASRTLHAVSFTFVARGDNGHREINYSHLLGALGAGAISNLYHPAGSRGLGNTFQDFGIGIAGNIAGNVFREFLLRHLETVPSFANGKRPGQRRGHASMP